MKIGIRCGIAEGDGGRIVEAEPDAELILLQPDGTLEGGGVDEIEVFFNAGELLTREGELGSVITEISRSPALQWFQSGAAGFENPMLEAIRDREGVRLTNAAGVHAEPIAQSVPAYLLQRVKRIPGHAEPHRTQPDVALKRPEASAEVLVAVEVVGRTKEVSSRIAVANAHV